MQLPKIFEGYAGYKFPADYEIDYEKYFNAVYENCQEELSVIADWIISYKDAYQGECFFMYQFSDRNVWNYFQGGKIF